MYLYIYIFPFCLIFFFKINLQGDQASIIGGAINYVKELEQHLQTLETKKRSTDQQQPENNNNNDQNPLFGDFFSFPQYSTRHSNTTTTTTSSTGMSEYTSSSSSSSTTTSVVIGADRINHREQPAAAVADIEVTMAESHANIKILISEKRRQRQLLKLVGGLQCLWLTILHLNVTTADQMVLYTVSVKVS